MRQSLHLLKSFFPTIPLIIENSESMQTIHDAWKYTLQQLFEMLSLSLDTGLEAFSPLVSGPVNDGQFKVSQNLNQSLLQFSQSTYWLLVYALLHATPDSVNTGFGSGLHSRHNSGGMISGTSLCRSLTVECARWACALSSFSNSGSVVAMETTQVILNSYKAFRNLNAMNLQLNADALWEKSFILCLLSRSYTNLF